MRAVLTLAALAALASAPTFAATPDPAINPAMDARYTPAFQQCLDSPGGQSTMGMVQCIGEELKVQDKALNAAYRDLVGDMNARQKANLLKAQRAWIAFRDAECDLDASVALGGSMHGMLVSDCRAAMTDERVKALKALRTSLADFMR